MPSYDSSRGRFRLADRHVAVLAHLLDKETPPAELAHSLSDLQQIGLVGPQGELSPLLRELLTVLARPVVVVQAETMGLHGSLSHGIVVGRDAVFSHDGWPGEEESEYTPIEPQTLVWEMARKVKLRRREADLENADGVSEIRTTMGTLDAVLSVLGEASDEMTARQAALGVLGEGKGDLRDPELSAFADLVLSLDSTWRMTAAWAGRPGVDSVRSIAVWDCGSYGYWLRAEPPEPVHEGQVTADSTLRLVRSSAGEIWDRLADLLPDKEDFADESA
ncbi:hypothetical protein [Streptomyces sp. NPDC002553]|uniref:hypothetical protein n=1 Tax=Streptomyces sp. NPDC002553 TaxID=3154417 RepID=UPI003320847D